MRTRLDEIVEEELRKRTAWMGEGRIEPDPVALRIAERAFRHGVERGVSAAIHDHPHVTLFDTVRPAPVEKKAEDVRYVCPYERCQMEHPERRKGQRRKEANWPQNYVHEVGVNAEGRPIYQHSPHGAWYYDRRSGKDRRKS